MLVIVRGLPGSGKSSFVKRYFDGYAHFEADMFHYTADGVYRWKPDNIKLSHEWCYGKVKLNLEHGIDTAVSNTFVKFWEIKKYTNLCEDLQVPFTVIKMVSQYKTIHNVPQETIDKMSENFEVYPTEITHEDWIRGIGDIDE